MKKKLTVNTLALSNLKRRRKQYSILIIGVILAMIFSSTALFFMKSANDTYIQKCHDTYGKQDVIFSVNGFSEKDYDVLKEESLTNSYGIGHILGRANSKGDKYFSVGWLDENAISLSNLKLISGKMPVKANEIAAEKSILVSLGYKDAKEGDTISLSLDIQNGASYLKTIDKKYKLTGILEDKYSDYSHGQAHGVLTTKFSL